MGVKRDRVHNRKLRINKGSGNFHTVFIKGRQEPSHDLPQSLVLTLLLETLNKQVPYARLNHSCHSKHNLMARVVIPVTPS